MADFGITQETFDDIRSRSVMGFPIASVPDYARVAVARTVIEAQLPDEMRALPYSANIMEDVSLLIGSDRFFEADYTVDQFNTEAQGIVAQAFSAHIQAAPAATRFTTLTQSLTELGAAVGDPQQAQINSAVTALGDLDPQLQTALTNAVAHNPNFVEYILEKMGNEDASGGLTAMLEDVDQQAVGPLTGILNNIANNPTMEMDALDNVIDTVTEHTRLTEELAAIPEDNIAERNAKADEIAEATTAMYAAIREAGGNLPALAGMNSTIMMAFMTDLVNGTGTEGAIANMGAALNLTPEQLEAMQELIGPFAGIIEFMVEPYAELYQEHGVAITDAIQRTQDRVGILTNPDQIQFTGEHGAAAPAVTATFQQEATVDAIVTVDFGNDFTNAMNDGRSYEEVLDIVDAMEAANSDFADEADLLRDALEDGIISEVQLRQAFGISASGVAPAAAEVEAGVEAFLDRARTAPSLQSAMTP